MHTQRSAAPTTRWRFTSSEDGNALMQRGALLPILGIHAWTYRLIAGDPSEADRALLGQRTIGPLRYRLAREAGKVFGGRSLGAWSQRQLLGQLPLSEHDGDVLVSAHATGEHGACLVPTLLFQPAADEGPLDEPLINRDPTDAWQQCYGAPDAPPWVAFGREPLGDATRASGDGLTYVDARRTKLSRLSANRRLDYFRQHRPIPLDWLETVGAIAFPLEDQQERGAGVARACEEGLVTSEEYARWRGR